MDGNLVLPEQTEPSTTLLPRPFEGIVSSKSGRGSKDHGDVGAVMCFTFEVRGQEGRVAG